jgi:sulfate/thiosulfate transport system substrate-binding protein
MRRFLPLALLIPVLAFTAAASAGGTTLHLVAFSTPQTVMKTLIGNWQKTSAGKDVSFTTSYGPSTTQANAIASGLPTDIAFLSNALDVNTLVTAKKVQGNWQKTLPAQGFVANSVVAFVVRPGNPKHITSWADLTKKGVQVVTPDPFPSGGAKWNVLAAYGAQRAQGKTDAQAQAYVKSLFKNVVAQPQSASAAMTAFLNGQGDVLITYESEAYTAQLAGKSLSIVVPKQTIQIQLPMVPTKTAPKQAATFIKYCHSTPAQKLFVQAGYRPVVSSVLKDPSLKSWAAKFSTKGHVIFPVTNSYFGGWIKAAKLWFSQPNGRMVKIEQSVGGPTS